MLSDPEIWEVRIYFDGVDNLERRIGRDDITYQQIVAMIELKGYSIFKHLLQTVRWKGCIG